MKKIALLLLSIILLPSLVLASDKPETPVAKDTKTVTEAKDKHGKAVKFKDKKKKAVAETQKSK